MKHITQFCLCIYRHNPVLPKFPNKKVLLKIFFSLAFKDVFTGLNVIHCAYICIVYIYIYIYIYTSDNERSAIHDTQNDQIQQKQDEHNIYIYILYTYIHTYIYIYIYIYNHENNVPSRLSL